MHIVIVDDEKTNCKLLELYVKKWGYKSISFTNSIKALKYLKTVEDPVIICIDWMMPEMSGIEVLKTIREARPDFPMYFIVITAKVGSDSVTKALDSGADDYVTKPFNSKELCSRIGSGKRVIFLEHRIIQKDKKLENINLKLKESLKIIEDDIKAGRAVQFKLLPENNKIIDGYKLSHFVEPSLYLSGDFLDYFVINDRYLGFYFIDVAGHGASSAFITVYVKSFFKNIISKLKMENNNKQILPATFVQDLNINIINTDLGKHLTIFIGIIDKKTKIMKYCNGGQFPFPIFHTEKETQFLSQKGFPVGLMQNANYENIELQLPEKFKLFLFSDGLLEILPVQGINKQQEFLLEIVKDNNLNYDSFLEKFQYKYNQMGLPDDVTCLIMSHGEENAKK